MSDLAHAWHARTLSFRSTQINFVEHEQLQLCSEEERG